MNRIFISYSRENQGVTKALAQDFEDLGHEVWYDHELAGGQAWWDHILENIRECDSFAFTLSPHALDSRACKLEWTYAHALGKSILPILVADDVSTKLLPSELSALQYVDYRHQDKKAAFALNKALVNLPDPKPLTDPLPVPPDVPVSYLGSLKDRIETAQALSFAEQSALVLELKARLSIQEEIIDVRELLQRLRRRDDLLAKIAIEVDSLLADIAPPEPESHPTKSASSRNISFASATEDIAEILKRVLCNSEDWTLNSSNNTIEISSSENTLVAQATWDEWGNPCSVAKILGLIQLKWKVDSEQWNRIFMVTYIAIITLGLAFLSPKFKNKYKRRRANRTWIKGANGDQLARITLDIVLALKTIDPNNTTITANCKTGQSADKS